MGVLARSVMRSYFLIGSFLLAPVAYPDTNGVQTLVSASPLPYEYPLFHHIHSSDYEEAVQLALSAHQRDIQTIVSQSNSPDFTNTILAFEKSGMSLARIERLLSNLNGANTDPVLQKAIRKVGPLISSHRDSIYMNSALFAKIEQVYQKRNQQKRDPESIRLIEFVYQDFVNAGAKLSEIEKRQLRSMNERLTHLSLAFAENLLNANMQQALFFDLNDLDGLTPAELRDAANAAKARGKEGKYLVNLINTSNQPILGQLKNRETRKKIYLASTTRAQAGSEYDNQNLVLTITSLRAQRAKLLGFPHHAAMQINLGTARTTDNVNMLLSRLVEPTIRNVHEEATLLQAQLEKDIPGAKLEPWDWLYYTEQVRKEKYELDAALIRPYFEAFQVLEKGSFFAAEKLYGITFRRRLDLPTYHPSVRVYEIFDHNQRPLALLIADLFSRDNKRGGAWMNNYQHQSRFYNKRPVVALHTNISEPAEGQRALMTLAQVKTMFHEFGHVLHGVFSDVNYERFAGTNVPRDFVEYPSQVNELWAFHKNVLQNYARHYQTGAVIPQEFIDKMVASERLNQGFHSLEVISAALIDQAWHQLSYDQIPDNVDEFELEVLRRAGISFPLIPPRYRTSYFTHIFNGDYSAGYYAYLWSEILDADTVEWFNERGGLRRENGDEFRRKILSRGASEDGSRLYQQFRGRPAKLDAFLKRRGLD